MINKDTNLEANYSCRDDNDYLGMGFNNILIGIDQDSRIKITLFNKVKQVLAKAIKTVVDFFKKLFR